MCECCTHGQLACVLRVCRTAAHLADQSLDERRGGQGALCDMSPSLNDQREDVSHGVESRQGESNQS